MRRGLAVSNDESKLSRVRAKVLDAIIVRIHPTTEKRDQHVQKQGLCWRVSTIIPSLVDVARIYDAIELHAKMQTRGELANVNISTYLRKRNAHLRNTKKDTPGSRTIMELFQQSLKSQRKVTSAEVPPQAKITSLAPPQARVGPADPSVAMRRREALHAPSQADVQQQLTRLEHEERDLKRDLKLLRDRRAQLLKDAGGGESASEAPAKVV